MGMKRIAIFLFFVILFSGLSSASATPPANEPKKNTTLNLQRKQIFSTSVETTMGIKRVAIFLIFVILFSGLPSTSATPPANTPPAKVISGIVSNVAYAIAKWLWSLKPATKTSTSVSSRPMMKFESGYNVETVFDGSKLGIDPYAVVEVPQSGDVLVLDSENSNIYRISTPFSQYSRPMLITGSAEGYSGHVDGRLREARMNHPKGITCDDRGNIYIADTLNMAIRKISDTGVVTIAGGKWGRGGHVDGPSEDARFSDDFDIIYIGSSCSLLVIDRGNQAIREIQLHENDCTHQTDEDLHLGVAVLAAAAFFGYMLALLQRRVAAMFSSSSNTILQPTLDQETRMRKGIPPPPYQRPIKSVRPPLIPPEDEYDKPEDGLFGSLGKLVLYTGSSMVEVFTGLFSSRKTHIPKQPIKYQNTWPMQESFVIPDEDEPPSLEPQGHTPKRTYPITNKDMDNGHRFKQTRASHEGWNGNFYHQYQQQQHYHHQQQQQQMQHHQKHYSAGPQTCYEQSHESNEIVFGAVQQQDGRRDAVVIKAVDYSKPMHSDHDIRARYNYMGYSHGY